MFSRDDVYALTVIGLFLCCFKVMELDKESKQIKSDAPVQIKSDAPIAKVDVVMLISVFDRSRDPAKVRWLNGKPYCSKYKDDSGLGLLLPNGHVDGVGNVCGWEPLTPNMASYYRKNDEIKDENRNIRTSDH